MGVFSILGTTLQGMFPLFFTTGIGGVLSQLSLLNKETNDKISVSIANFFSPLLCLINISYALDLSEFRIIWPLIVAPIISIVLFSCIGFIFTRVFKVPAQIKNTMIAVLILPNFGLVFIMIQGICSPYGPLSGNTNCDDGFSYISNFMFPMLLIF